jgi:tRNA threonylcarbamoyladenosine biosynthesis protein TsaB
LALGADLPVAGVCTLQALAQASGHDKVIAALDARMAEVYHAAYEKCDENWIVVTEPGLCLPQDISQVKGTGWFGVGSGFEVHGAALEARYSGQLIGINAQAFPQASAIAQLAAVMFQAGLGVDAAQAMPLYLRDKVALKTCER